MVGAHVTDAWTRDADRQRTLYMYTVFVAGLAAPLFLFLAGLTLAMAASSRAATVGHAGAAAAGAHARLQVFALAFLFRLQSQLLGWGALINFLKVDILNVMGLAMIAAALPLGRLGESRVVRIAAVRDRDGGGRDDDAAGARSGVLARAAGPIEAYIRPLPGRTNFALFPWAASCSRARSPASSCPPRRPSRRSGGCRPACCCQASPASRSATRRRSGRRSIRSRTSGPARRRSSSSGSASARRWCRSRAAIDRFHAFVRAQLAAMFSPDARPRHHDARPLVAVRLLDSRRDGLRRARPAAPPRAAARGVARRHRRALRAALRDRAVEGSADDRTSS